MECISDRAYPDREALATDIVRVLREEVHHLLASGVAPVQLGAHRGGLRHAGTRGRTLMCGALGERRGTDEELGFARDLLQECSGACRPSGWRCTSGRGNWSPDEQLALSGDYLPLMGLLGAVEVGTLVLELCAPAPGRWTSWRRSPTTAGSVSG